jgi:hypothetical protein
MSGLTTRRAFIGGGAALAVGAGVARLPDAITRQRHRLAFDSGRLEGSGSSPAFGTLKPGSGPTGPLSGDLLHRDGKQHAGRLTITSAGVMQVHALELADGTLVAVGHEREQTHSISSGTGRYANAHGRITIRSGASASLALDVELEL